MFELADLELSQYQRRALHDIKRKGEKVTKRIPLSPDTCKALDRYIKEEREGGAGTLFQSRNGNPLAQQDVDYVLRRIASQANARLWEKDRIEVSPHVLRYTALRKWTEKKGVHFAQKIAGHASERYIWRYVMPSESEMDEAADSLWEQVRGYPVGAPRAEFVLHGDFHHVETAISSIALHRVGGQVQINIPDADSLLRPSAPLGRRVFVDKEGSMKWCILSPALGGVLLLNIKWALFLVPPLRNVRSRG